MNHYRLKIKPKFLKLVAEGIKKREYRLNTPERSLIAIGDRITLVSNQDDKQAITVCVNNIKKYTNWEDALKDNWRSDFEGLCCSLEESISTCSKLYSLDEVNQYGIVVFGIEPIKRHFKNVRVLLDTNIIIQREGYNNVSSQVSKLYKWLDILKCQKLVSDKTAQEIEKYKDKFVSKTINTKLESYEAIISHEVQDLFFNDIVGKYSMDENSLVDNELLYQVYDGVADLLITNDNKMLLKAYELGVRDCVLSVDEYLRVVENEFPKNIDYKVLSIRKEKFGKIDLGDLFFNSLKEDYPGFDKWFINKSQEEAYVFRDEGKIHAFLYIKTEYPDEKDYKTITPILSPKKRLKIGTFKIDKVLSGFRLSERFIKIIIDNALNNHVQEIYVTLFENKRKEVDQLKKVLCKWGFKYHGYKISNNGKKESVFVKSLEFFDKEKDIKFNFPNMPESQKMFFLPIEPEYHTDLFPDSKLRNEDMSLYSDNKGHRYALEKIYVSSSFDIKAKPGDYIVIYRKGDRWPKRYSSLCSCLAVLEEIIYPQTLNDYLAICSNKSVFSKEELEDFFDNKKYRTVVKLILYKTYKDKILLDELIRVGLFGDNEGPRPFTEIPVEFYKMFLKGWENEKER